MNKKVKALFLDIDGTLTVNRSGYELSVSALHAVRQAVRKGLIVSLVSSSALPVVAGLSRYIGLNGPAIGESGCLILHDDWGLVELARRSAREPFVDVIKVFGDYVESSWQNYFRLYEYALRPREGYRGRAMEIWATLKKYVEEKYPGFTVDYSGYALHVKPADVDKKGAVLYVLSRLGIEPDEAAGVGDSTMDIPFLGAIGISAAVSNADEELKRRVSIVLSKPSGEGVAEFIEIVTSS
ncbi:MAG: phosphoglycolate phosphatase [Desulfurococcaceae archaeon]